MAGVVRARHPSYRLTILVALIGVLVTGCASAKSGKGVADGDEAAAYVSAKFEQNLRSLSGDLAGYEPRKSKLRRYVKLDEKTSNKTVTAIQVGSPPDRFVKDQLNDKPSDSLVTFHPARSKVKYLLLGPRYSSLAPTPWVSMPYTEWNLSPCAWKGYRAVCKMLNTVADAADRGNAAKKATSLANGGVQLQAEVTVRDFLKNKVVIFPEELLSRFTQDMKSEAIKASIMLGPDGGLRSIAMNTKLSDGTHKLEIHMKYQVLAPPSKSELPSVPAGDKVTALKDKKAVNDFYRRMDELQ